MATRPTTTATAKACRTFISLSLFFLSLARPFYFAPCVPFAISRSLPLSSLCRREREDEGMMWRRWRRRRRRRWRKKRLAQRLLICFFRYSSHFPSPTAANGRRCLLSPFSSSFTSSLARIPSPDCNSGGLSAPRTAVYFYCDVLPPPPPPPPSPARFLSATPTFPRNLNHRCSGSASFYPCCPRVLFSSFLPSFLSAPRLALPVVSNFAKGWRRECAPRPSHGGVFFLHHLAFLPPSAPLPRFAVPLFLRFFRRSYFSRTRAAVSR